MLEHLRSFSARPTFLLAAGIALGALLAPSLGGGAAQGVTTYTRTVSCHGLAWQPIASVVGYDSTGTLRTGKANGYFVCGVDLPHQAVVTRVRFTLYDETPGGNVNDCSLVRAGLTSGTAATAQRMATVGTTMDSSAPQRLTDTTISFATVDNTNFAYYLQCQINTGETPREGVYGADITYKITAANG